MKPSEANEIITMIDSMNRTRDTFAPTMIDQKGRLQGLGPLWRNELLELDAAIVTDAVVALYTSSASIERPRPVTPKDVTDMVKKLEKDRRMAVPALPEAEFARKPPEWVRGKVLALRRNDNRVWPEQKPGYDSLQRSNEHNRSYIWSEQVAMSDEERERYIAEAARMSSKDFEEVYEQVFGTVADYTSEIP